MPISHSVLIFFLLTWVLPDSTKIDFFLAGSINGGVPEIREAFDIKQTDQLVIYPVFKQDSLFYSAVDSFVIDGGMAKTRGDPGKVKSLKKREFRWLHISPVLREYDNLHPPDDNRSIFYIAPIEYTTRLIPSEWSEEGLSFCESFSDSAVGTYYLSMCECLCADTFFDTRPIHQRFSHHVVQIVVRPHDTYVGYLYELFNTPFILPPKPLPGSGHQTDLRVGSDCAEFAIYGMRRMGHDIPYAGPQDIYNYLKELSTSLLYPDSIGIYRDKDGVAFQIGEKLRRGDVIHFGEQVSVFYTDQGVPGILDKNDLLIQSYIPSPHITPIESCGFYHLPLRVFEWSDKTD